MATAAARSTGALGGLRVAPTPDTTTTPTANSTRQGRRASRQTPVVVHVRVPPIPPGAGGLVFSGRPDVDARRRTVFGASNIPRGGLPCGAHRPRTGRTRGRTVTLSAGFARKIDQRLGERQRSRFADVATVLDAITESHEAVEDIGGEREGASERSALRRVGAASRRRRRLRRGRHLLGHVRRQRRAAFLPRPQPAAQQPAVRFLTPERHEPRSHRRADPALAAFCRERFPELDVTLGALQRGPPVSAPVQVRLSGRDQDRLFDIMDASQGPALGRARRHARDRRPGDAQQEARRGRRSDSRPPRRRHQPGRRDLSPDGPQRLSDDPDL